MHALLLGLLLTVRPPAPPDYSYLGTLQELAIVVRAPKNVRAPYLSQQLEALFKKAEFRVLPSSTTQFVIRIELTDVGVSPESIAAHVSASLQRTYPGILPEPRLATVLLWSSSQLFVCPRSALHSRLEQEATRLGGSCIRDLRSGQKQPSSAPHAATPAPSGAGGV